ncbi:unnamed protein product [Cuscuta campestris]|uniref:Cyclin delta-3 n=1 Tax=Cuscuta campestris TaxID=132261 RepID=A0A484KV83_9ASTE|nr:unnamed protein product [Cuscuta campestris]
MMSICCGSVAGNSRAALFPSPLFRRSKTAFRCYSSSSDHASFIKNVAATQPPEHLNCLLNMLQVRGEQLVSPTTKKGVFPLAIPLSKQSSGAVTALLRWPTAPLGMEMPMVEVRKYGVWLLAKNVDQYIHRILVEEDACSHAGSDALFHASAGVQEKVYKRGEFAASQISSLDIYLWKKVGLFPDLIERKIKQHFDKGDDISAMVTGEFYTRKEHFPGFGRPFVFNAEILLKVGRRAEAKDAARGALKSPWWTLGCEYKNVAKMAEWEEEQIEFIKEKVTKEGREQDLKKGKDTAQIALDEAAFLLDLASVDGNWDDCVDRIGECYKDAGLHDMANFVVCRD